VTYSLKVSRSGSPLELMNPPAYEVIGRFDPGEVTADLKEVEGDYQHGSNVLGYRLRRGVMRMQVKVRGASPAQVESRASALVSAFRQVVFTITYAKGGVTHEWRCHPASIVLVRGMDAVDVEQNTAVYALTIPRQPVPIQGAL
jgi:hypothetical protein